MTGSEVKARRPPTIEQTAVVRGLAWRWSGWASWTVTPAVLVAAFVAVALDVGSAWLGWPSWAIGTVLVSPALPVGAALVVLVGWTRVGCSRRSLAAWREYLVGGSLTVLVAALAYAQTIAGWREVEGVMLAAAGE